MKSPIVNCIIIFLIAGCSRKLDGDIIIKNVSVINVLTGSVSENMDIVIIKDSISNILPHRKNTSYLANEVIDGNGQYVLPGLWDMHTHTWWGYKEFFPMLTVNGITGIREMWGEPGEIRKIRNKIDSGLIIGPDIISSGAILDGNPPLWQGSDSTNSPEKARQYVRQQKLAGADFIKVYSFLERDVYFAIADECKKTGIPFVGHIPFKISVEEAIKAGQVSLEHFFGILDYASSEKTFIRAAMINKTRNDSLFENRKFSTFLNRMKFETDTYDKSTLSALIILLAKSDSWLCPTFVATEGSINRSNTGYKADNAIRYMPDYAIQGWQLKPDSSLIPLRSKNQKIENDWYNLTLSLCRQMKDGGVKFLAGTDYPNPYCYPGFSLHEELKILVKKAGFTPFEALQTATINPAVFLKIDKYIGTVEIGKKANLLILRANPLDNINNTKQIEAVIQGGKFYRTTVLQDSLELLIKKAKLTTGN